VTRIRDRLDVVGGTVNAANLCRGVVSLVRVFARRLRSDRREADEWSGTDMTAVVVGICRLSRN